MKNKSTLYTINITMSETTDSKENKSYSALEQIAASGIVGAGGAGFPTHAKLNCRTEIIIANGAECEPLIHKDKELMAAYPETIVSGLKKAMQITGAQKGIIAIKKKATEAIEALTSAIQPPVEIKLLDDTYPAGDEFVLTYEATGRIPPAGGLPIDVGVVVQNIETLLWIGMESPVVTKHITVAGAVPSSRTVKTPIGTPVIDVLNSVGLEMNADYKTLVGGVMMGRLLKNPDEPVLKTTNGLIVLPYNHPLIQRYSRTEKTIDKINHSVCDQCSFCTELCPRYLLGHPIRPHIAMRYHLMAPDGYSPASGAEYCCSCMLCSFSSCPEGLDPGHIMTRFKTQLLQDKSPDKTLSKSQHPLYEYRKAPISNLKRRLGLDSFMDSAPLKPDTLKPSEVTILLKQHIGVPAIPVVKQDDRVKKGDLIASIPTNQLGAAIHASIDGIVTEINNHIKIRRETS